jgi:large subunit ribosomal protein L9
MKVILQRDIPKVGKGGDIVNVADGYARNYLFPRQYAVSASGGALKEHTARAQHEKSRSAGLLKSAEADAAKLEGKTLIIMSKVGTGTKLYGSITAQDVTDAIQKDLGVTVDKRRVGVVDPIKSLGEYNVPVRLHTDVSVNVKVLVTTEEDLARRKAQAAAEEAKAKAAAEAAAAAAPAEADEVDEEIEDETAEASEETTAEADTGESADGAEEQSAGE